LEVIERGGIVLWYYCHGTGMKLQWHVKVEVPLPEVSDIA